MYTLLYTTDYLYFQPCFSRSFCCCEVFFPDSELRHRPIIFNELLTWAVLFSNMMIDLMMVCRYPLLVAFGLLSVLLKAESTDPAEDTLYSPYRDERRYNCDIYLAPSPPRGWGVYAARDFEKNDVIEVRLANEFKWSDSCIVCSLYSCRVLTALLRFRGFAKVHSSETRDTGTERLG